MFANRMKPSVCLSAMIGSLLVAGFCGPARAVSNHFTAVANEATSNADSRRAITFFDADNMGGGPLFSVAMPWEANSGSNAYEEISAISVDPSTGNIYILAFDNVGPTDTATQYGSDATGNDTTGDWDLYKLNFQTVLNHWKTNFEGKDARSLGGALAVSGPVPFVPAGGVATSTPPNTNPALAAANFLDYITYGSTNVYSAAAMTDPVHLSPNGATDQSHSNGFALPGAIEKIGEINRNRYTGTSNFFTPSMSFINSSTLFMIDDARQAANLLPSTANDNDYRIIKQVSTSPGLATVSNNPLAGVRTEVDGGFNRGTTQSWESTRIAQALLDTDESLSLLSEMQACAYYSSGTIKGAWVADRDRPAGGNNPVPDTETGDDIAFLQLDVNYNSLGYRTFSSNNLTKFDMDNDPGGAAHGPGHVGQLFTATNGDLIVVEEGFTDAISGSNPNGLPNSEPAVIRGAVNYDNGGKISIAWGTKMFLTPAKNMGDTFKERGYFSAYDASTNKVYFAEPGSGTETPTFQMAYYVLDLNTGLTSSYLNLDESVSLFFGGSNTDNNQKVVAFSLVTGVAGDYNDDGVVDAADYIVWREHFGQTFALPHEAPGVTTGMVTQEDYDYWKMHFGETPGSGSGSLSSGTVPEPASAALLALGLVGMFAARRRFGR